MKAIQGKITGKVQGVGFRMYLYRQAERLDLTGWVTNNQDGSVDFHCEGSDVDLSYFIDLAKRGNEFSEIDNVTYHESTVENFKSFKVKS